MNVNCLNVTIWHICLVLLLALANSYSYGKDFLQRLGPKSQWDVATSEGNFLVVVTEPEFPKSTTRSPQFDLSLRGKIFYAQGHELILEQSNPTCIYSEKLDSIFPSWPPHCAIACNAAEKEVFVVVEMQGGASYFEIGYINLAHPDKTRWSRLRTILCSNKPPDYDYSVSVYPTAVRHNAIYLLAGAEIMGGIWVGRSDNIATSSTSRLVNAMMLGRGENPSLMSFQAVAYCFAISADKLARKQSIACWSSNDGSNWAPFDIGITQNDVAGVSAWSNGKKGYITTWSNTSPLLIRVYQMDDPKNKAREIYQLKGAGNMKPCEKACIRTLEGNPYLFRDEERPEGKAIVITAIESKKE
ncbi:MAG: hypothetical protein NTX50_20065 [Candidatus Sumerlaeota bacterium]|nr:hypothetical protein [Candidatus Sumerlaeota bacterium]